MFINCYDLYKTIEVVIKLTKLQVYAPVNIELELFQNTYPAGIQSYLQEFVCNCQTVSDLRIIIVLGCVHEQKAHGGQWILSAMGVVNKVYAAFVTLMGLNNLFKAQ